MRRDPAAVARGRVERHRAPSRADLEQVVVGRELELAAGELELGLLRLGECHAGAIPNGAGVGHRLIEEEAKQVVPEVVVRGDVATGVRARVARHARERPSQRREGRSQPVERGISRAPIRTSETRSSQSHAPEAYDSAIRRLPRGAARQKTGSCTLIVARRPAPGVPKPRRRPVLDDLEPAFSQRSSAALTSARAIIAPDGNGTARP